MTDHLPPPGGPPTGASPSGVPPPPPPPSSPPDDRHPWAVPFNAFDGLGLVVWTLLAQIIVGVGLAVVALATGNNDAIEDGGALTSGAGLLVVAAAAQIFTLAGVFVYLNMRRRLSGHLFGSGPHGWSRVALGLAAGVGGYVGVTLLVLLGSLVVDPGEPNQAALEASTGGTAAFILGIAVAGILAPVLEEVVFRGVLFQSLRHRMGVGWAVMLSSLAFALVHLELIAQPLLLTGLFALAAFLALLLHWTRSLVVPIVAHATFNSITLVIASFAPDLEV